MIYAWQWEFPAAKDSGTCIQSAFSGQNTLVHVAQPSRERNAMPNVDVDPLKKIVLLGGAFTPRVLRIGCSAPGEIHVATLHTLFKQIHLSYFLNA